MRVISPSKIRNKTSVYEIGFAITEAILMAVLLAIAALGTVAMFTVAISQSRRSDASHEDQVAINQDLSAIQQFNERIICTSASSACTLSTGTPGEAGYINTSYSIAGANYLRDRCNNVSSSTIADEAVTLLTTVAVPTPSNFTALNLSRTVSTNSSDRLNHVYTVTWLDSGSRIRQIKLKPLVASWCP